jgi:23S rRNA pseudouridine1911/1915/1917 synthase
VKHTHLEVPLTARGERIDRFVADAGLGLSRARVQQLIELGLIKQAERPVAASHRLRGGEQLTVAVPGLIAAVPQPEDLPLQIVWQDADLVVVNKRVGVVVHPGAGHAQGTLVNALLHHVGDLAGINGELRPGIVHRLDKDTSGLLVVAKTDRALLGLQKAFASREIEKRYRALVAGRPEPEADIHTFYGRHPTQRVRFTGRLQQGKRAHTRYRTITQWASAAEIEVELLTGRTHQIRVHLAEQGHPLLGDALYGGKAGKRPDIIERQALHAWRLAFAHPVTGKALRFEAELPADYRKAQAALTKP